MSSKFSQALQAKQASLQESEDHAKDVAPAIELVAPQKAEIPLPAPTKSLIASAPEPDKAPNANGLMGKRSNADYMQVNVYLKKETTNQAKIALLQTKDARDFSELMEDLLCAWVSQVTP